ncbi:MAG TPA: hypothetical protein VGZ22_19900, partial [Isosphaeraceae bacterium]|nr:hypothetical protein [Isosphaeraceae bacterium]
NGSLRGRLARAVSPTVVFGSAVAGALLFYQPGVALIQAVLLASTLPLAALAGIALHHRVRSQQRWRAAWEAYGAWDLAREPIGTFSVGTSS